jgi:segregation and condensation protein A
MNEAFTLRLERVFQGPMDLLLHLVREQEVEIHEIEIARVLESYLAYLGALKDLDIEVAGDFLVMAATLMSIKSRSLLPGEEVDLEDDLDPRDELIQRLIEYRRFKEASDHLGERWELRAARMHRGGDLDEPAPSEPVLELGELSAWDLLSAFSRLVRETLANRPHRVIADTRPLRYYVGTLAHRIRVAREVSLRDLIASFDEPPSREDLIGSFCALLELVKLGLVGVAQPGRGDDIVIRLCEEHASDIETVVEASIFDDETEAAELGLGSPAPEAAATDGNHSVPASEAAPHRSSARAGG